MLPEFLFRSVDSHCRSVPLCRSVDRVIHGIGPVPDRCGGEIVGWLPIAACVAYPAGTESCRGSILGNPLARMDTVHFNHPIGITPVPQSRPHLGSEFSRSLTCFLVCREEFENLCPGLVELVIKHVPADKVGLAEELPDELERPLIHYRIEQAFR